MSDETANENTNNTVKPVESETIKTNAVTSAKLKANEVRFETLTPGDAITADSDVTPSWLIPDKVYDVLKWVGLIALPASAVCVQTIGTAAGWTGTDLTVTQQQQEMVLVIGENIKVRRFARFAEGVCVPYIHAGGKIGVLVNLSVEGEASDKVLEMGKDVAMQIAALNPRFWDKSQVTEDVLAEEKKIMLAQMDNDPKMASKPAQVKEKIVEGKLNKFYAENCLLQQEFVKDNSMTVEQYMNAVAKEAGVKVTLKDAVRFEKGEGIEKKQDDFAAEIASMVGGK